MPPGFPRVRPPLNRPNCAGGFAVHDRVLDFPGLIEELRQRFASLGGRVHQPARATNLLKVGDAISGVQFELQGVPQQLNCRWCVIAMGAWSLGLLQTIDVHVPVALMKSDVLVFEGEFTDSVVGWLDAPGVTIVPYKGVTLIADGRNQRVYNPDNLHPNNNDLDSLYADLSRCFPEMDANDLRARLLASHGCIKTCVGRPPRPIFRRQDPPILPDSQHNWLPLRTRTRRQRPHCRVSWKGQPNVHPCRGGQENHHPLLKQCVLL